MAARKGTLGKIYEKAKEVASSALAGAAQGAVDGVTRSDSAPVSRSSHGRKKPKVSSGPSSPRAPAKKKATATTRSKPKTKTSTKKAAPTSRSTKRK